MSGAGPDRAGSDGAGQWLARIGDYEAGLADPATLFHVGLARGSMTVELYRPAGEDHQTPHSRDELYIVRTGRAQFVRDGARVAVSAGDTIFVPARMEHRFEQFTADFDTWVVFWGPEGGEK